MSVFVNAIFRFLSKVQLPSRGRQFENLRDNTVLLGEEPIFLILALT